MTPVGRSNVLFYLLYAVAAKILNKKEINFSALRNLNFSQVNETIINKIKKQVYIKYKELGGNGCVAKSSSFMKFMLCLICKITNPKTLVVVKEFNMALCQMLGWG